MHVFSNCFNETTNWLQTTFQSCRSPTFDKSISGPTSFIIPEVFKLILQDPCAMDSTVAFPKSVEYPCVFFERLDECLYNNHRSIELFNDMESIKDQSDIGTMIFNRIDVSLAHVTGSPFNFAFLVITKHFLKKTVDCFLSLTFTNPDNACFFNVINDGRIFKVLAI